ncbi:EmrKY-TolC multidrug resistance efflux pump, membrane fusion protein component [Escherichia coli]|uniref:EmrKY-TolC multidrug resistance efflux pump, membrane fusion protein component n=1 Tax=Escherichia coli TaxID=562 RepID=A0A376TUP9_ECOLX|nr:EmrKY-TolC multidrug resistance efflux pump, membrane fusion protein component [Escherichia coli]
MEQINSNKKHSNRRKYFSLLAVVLFIAFSGAYAYWSMELEDMISTDDAYVTGNADPISAQVSVVSLSLIIKIRTTFDKVTF